ncbi:MAG: biotin--[acetyl-CoA-carboxylase] ligase [Flavobacteriaceae bacterium]|nr:biotin--[acetyl-CoA-carboxylase] ligase [Flavobacteriaceae bacterium]
MKIIKLDATDSTNTFLKELCREGDVDDFTIVITDYQTNGRGQMSSSWESIINKNLTFSILTKFNNLNIESQFYISKAISLAIYDTLFTVLSTKISIKWPNDILAEQRKICGILIENSVKKSKINYSIVGIGLNVNQTVFKNLPNATSMKLISDRDFNLDGLLDKLVKNIEKYIKIINANDFIQIDNLYLKRLYKINTPTMFRDAKETIFMGKITGISTNGRLQVELQSGDIEEFSLKEISFNL